jgi:protein-tyrosine-phosphatase
VVDDLAYTYEGIVSRESIAQAVANAREALEPTATIPDFLPLLVSRFAREQLTAAAQADGRLIKPVPELLFVCGQNAGRSQMAAALAQHLSAGKVHVRSAGSKPADKINPMAVQVLAERGITLTEAYPKPLTNDVVHAADVIVTMGCGVPVRSILASATSTGMSPTPTTSPSTASATSATICKLA